MFRRFMMAFACLLSVATIAPAAQATVFGFGFLIDFGNGDGAAGAGKLFADDNGDGTYTVTGATGSATYLTFSTGDFYAPATIIGAGPGWFSGSDVSTITRLSDDTYSFDSLVLVGTDWRFYDFENGDDGLVGFAGEVGGPAQFQFGLIEGGVPETATWAMMLLGFGAMGVAMRRRTAVSFA